MWAEKYIEDNGLDPHILHKKIADNIDELKGHFADDVLTLTEKSLKGFRSLDEKLSWMLFVDGCSLLHILENADLNEPELMNIKADQLVPVVMDVLLLENQLPYLVLKLLWKNENETELIDTMVDFLRNHHWAPDNRRTWRSRIQEIVVPNIMKEEEVWLSILNESELNHPAHLLDLQRKSIIKSPSKTKGNVANNKKQGFKISKGKTKMMGYTNMQDLRAAGIRLKSSGTQRISDIDFSEGWFAARLTLPLLVVDLTTATFFLNLIAYEMCPDFENDYEICCFADFMDSLIDHPKDVKELRSNGILLNSLGSDEEIAALFNIINVDLVPNIEIYFEVRSKIHKHCRNLCKTWIAQGIHTYFNGPWAFISFLAAFIALALTFVQTWFAINPADK
ncbi:hypothetical protein TSUD_23340 [Trifolium subterraneum]|uniref:DUF247 domain-containing protein n=1 Tax=Trifolium subterraneum TaxID=3900 RepID=A0A2Z6N4V3_TRISU|nr:hypothetical protein TSUD_23340 [Trifolium subterraneum]